MSDGKNEAKRSPFPRLYWLVVLFEFFERGSYYGMMSVLSVYLTDVLHFAKQDVGIIKGTIQPLLYFLPIISGALADRFGYRRTLMVAFSLLGTGYFLTSQATEYSMVFLALVVMGLGAGTFKPVISGTIARCTDETNSTLGFGIFYWSINLGAFLFPLFLVPYLRDNVGWDWVIIASAIGTGALLLPTALVFREPPAPKVAKAKTDLLQTLANAFEILYSPFVLLHHFMRVSAVGVVLVVVLLGGLLGYGSYSFLQAPEVMTRVYERMYRGGGGTLVIALERNLTRAEPFSLTLPTDRGGDTRLTLHDPDHLATHTSKILAAVHKKAGMAWVSGDHLERFVKETGRRVTLNVTIDRSLTRPFQITKQGQTTYLLAMGQRESSASLQKEILAQLATMPDLSGLSAGQLASLQDQSKKHPFLLVFIGLLMLTSLVIMRICKPGAGGKTGMMLATLGVLEAVIWGLHLTGYLSLFAAILCGIIALTLLALFAIDFDDRDKFVDHARFLLMIFLYSGFWVLYFQMFDSVLWYVQAYVDASSLNLMVSNVLKAVGFDIDWKFNVEHVTVINAGTIILLQLVISNIVKNTRAMPTMLVGICMGTLGMAILAISTGIWILMLGITIFSIGEMTAHPKFISYVGQTAPKDRVAMYMGYLFLYGVIGSSIGGVVGANLYVKFVDDLNQPRTLWLIFTGIGVATIVLLLLYNAFFGKKEMKDEKKEA